MEITNEQIREAIKVLKTQKSVPFRPYIDSKTLNRLGVTAEEATSLGFDVFESPDIKFISK